MIDIANFSVLWRILEFIIKKLFLNKVVIALQILE